MSPDFHIFPDRGLVVVRYGAQADADSTGRAFARYMAHPDYRPGQRQLVDLSAVEHVVYDFAGLLKLQAHKADGLMPEQGETLIVYLAPTPATVQMAQFIERSWSGIAGVVPIVVESEAEALALLGQPETSVAALFAALDDARG